MLRRRLQRNDAGDRRGSGSCRKRMVLDSPSARLMAAGATMTPWTGAESSICLNVLLPLLRDVCTRPPLAATSNAHHCRSERAAELHVAQADQDSRLVRLSQRSRAIHLISTAFIRYSAR